MACKEMTDKMNSGMGGGGPEIDLQHALNQSRKLQEELLVQRDIRLTERAIEVTKQKARLKSVLHHEDSPPPQLKKKPTCAPFIRDFSNPADAMSAVDEESVASPPSSYAKLMQYEEERQQISMEQGVDQRGHHHQPAVFFKDGEETESFKDDDDDDDLDVAACELDVDF